jgi:hypothetical protein
MLAPFLVGVEILFQKIGKEKYLQNNKHDKQFQKDNNPDLTPPTAHVFEAANIKIPDTDKYVIFFIRHFC